jgi:hypothetical protein
MEQLRGGVAWKTGIDLVPQDSGLRVSIAQSEKPFYG